MHCVYSLQKIGHLLEISHTLILVTAIAVHALPCRIAFERGKERHFHFLAVSVGTLGWVLLAEELPLKQNYGIVRVAAPLAGTNVSSAIYSVAYFILNAAELVCTWLNVYACASESGNWEGLEVVLGTFYSSCLELAKPSTKYLPNQNKSNLTQTWINLYHKFECRPEF